MKKTFLSTLGLLLGLTIFAQIPNGYYDDAEGLSGAQLKTALYGIINDHDAQSYSSIWTHFHTTDDKPNGKVWDMYSDIPGGTPPYEYNFGTNQCGSYSEEGDCYNREHSFPKSWFNDASPMVTDIFHIVPTDGYVNSQRSNYPFGEVNNPSWTSLNGSKKGNNSTSGYSGTVFEPRDEYKGDFARIYFYMATRYENVIANWDNNSSEADAALNGTTYPCYETWYLNLLLAWNQSDPVSTKEIDRNNAIYNIQENRNPYVDHPEYVALVWGGNAAPVIANVNYTPNPPNEGVAVNVTATITDDGTVSSAYIYWGYSASNLSNSVAMTHSGSAYSGQIPGQNGGTQVYFKITATDNLGVSTSSSILNYTVTNSNTSPIITNVQHTPVAPSPDDDVTVSATITDNGTITQAKVLWGYSAGNLANEIVMSHSGSLYSGTIDAQTAGTVVYYKVQATDNEGVTSNSSTYSYTVTANNTAPVITSVQHSPSSPSPDDDVTVSATITDNGTITQAKVLWGYSAGNLANEIVMSHSGSLYSGTIDAQTAGTVVYYKVQATDNEGVTSNSSTFNYTVVTNNTSPLISNVQHTPTSPDEGEIVTVSATITDDGTISSATIKWGYTSDNLANSVAMTHSGNTYSGQIPGQDADITIYYKVSATDNEGATSNSAINQYNVAGNTNPTPVISNITQYPTSPTNYDYVTISAQITDNGSIEVAEIQYGLAQGQLTQTVDMNSNGNVFSGQIPPHNPDLTIYYRIKAYDDEGAFSYSSVYSYYVDLADGVTQVLTSDLMIVPNPAQQFIQISSEKFATENANVELFNVSGQVIQRISSYPLNEKIDIHGLRSGYYYAKITIGGRISFLPFVVRK